MKKGAYGLTYQEVYLMDNLTIEAKAIYGMLCSFAGTGDVAYPSVDFMCDKLHIGRTRFYKHINLLIGAGVVEKKALKGENGLFLSNVYTLVPNSQNTQNPHTENGYTDNGYTENGYTENEYTKINSFTINTNNNNTKKNNVCPEPLEKAPDPSGILLPLNDKTTYAVPLSKIETWAAAYPAVDVKQELLKMRSWLESNPQRRKTRRGITRFIDSWLSKEQDRGGRYRQQGAASGQTDQNRQRTREKPEYYKFLEGCQPKPDDPFQ